METTRVGPVRFQSTRWLDVLQAQSKESPASREFLEQLIERYWRPVYLFIRQKGNAREDAKDLTQQFFTEFVEKESVHYADRSRGKFRSFLLAAVFRFLATQYRREARRPNEFPTEDIQAAVEASGFGTSETVSPERAFDRNWAKSLIESSIARLREECERLGKGQQYRVFEARYLRRTERPLTYKAIAAEFGISETDVDNSLRGVKPRLQDILLNEVALSTNGSLGEVEDEICDLFQCLVDD